MATQPTFTFAGAQRGARRSVPLSLFAVPFGIAFGAAALEGGMTPVEAMMTSMVVFAGASQFAALDLWGDPLPYLSLAIVVFTVNARLIMLGAAIAPWLNAVSPAQRFTALAFMTDANFADSVDARREGENDVAVLLGGGLLLYTSWIFGTAVGIFAGAVVEAIDTFGVDVVMGAFFTAVVIGGVRSRLAVVPVVVGAVVAVGTMGLLPSGWNIIAAALAGGASMAVAGAKR
ncbi:MAG: AzlC family ABC transporter permease [Pseudomonadota bacterium]